MCSGLLPEEKACFRNLAWHSQGSVCIALSFKKKYMQAIKKRWLGAGTGRRDREGGKRGTKKKRTTVRTEKRARKEDKARSSAIFSFCQHHEVHQLLKGCSQDAAVSPEGRETLVHAWWCLLHPLLPSCTGWYSSAGCCLSSTRLLEDLLLGHGRSSTGSRLRLDLQAPRLHKATCFVSNGTVWNKICLWWLFKNLARRRTGQDWVPWVPPHRR